MLKNVCTKTHTWKSHADWLQGSGPDIFAKEMWPLNSSKLNALYYKVYTNVRGLSQVPSKTEDNRQTHRNAAGDSLSQGPIDKISIYFWSDWRPVSHLRVDIFNVNSNCNAVLLYYFNVNDVILMYDCLDVFEHAKITRWHNCNADNFETL